MAKNSVSEYSVNKLILDTSFIVPLLGINISGQPLVIKKLSGVKFLYPILMLPELIGVLFKILKKERVDTIPIEVLVSFDALIYGDLVELIPPDSSDVELVYELIKLGWKDLFDGILYATAEKLKVLALTLDVEFRNFLKKQGFNYWMLVTPKDLKL